MQVKITKKVSAVLAPKPEKAPEPTNARFVHSFDGRSCRDCPTSKPQPDSKIY